jgi:phospholipase D1/2
MRSTLKVHDVTAKHVGGSGHVYAASLSCDDADDATIEYQWTIRFTLAQLQHVASPQHAFLRSKIQSVADGLIGKRGAAPRGAPTVRVAMRDRLVRSATWTLRLFAGSTLLLVVSLGVQRGVSWLRWAVRTNSAPAAVADFVDALATDVAHLDPKLQEVITDYVVGDGVGDLAPSLLLVMCGVLLTAVSSYWLFDVFVLRMLPSKMLLHYQYANVADVRRDLEVLIADKDRLRHDEAVVSLLKFSNQALRHRLPTAVREGFVHCRFQPRVDHDDADSGANKNPRASIDLGLCRCACELGIKSRIGKWHRRWAVLRPTGMAFFRAPFDKSPTHIILFDTQFYAARGRTMSPKLGEVHSVPKLAIGGSNLVAELALVSDHDARSWFQAVNFATSPTRCEWTQEHRFGSFAPRRLKTNTERGVPVHQAAASAPRARWFLNGRGYYAAVSIALAQAQREIFVTGWFFTPTVLLTRAATGTGGESDESIADALQRAAQRGVKVYVLLYEEIPQALANNSAGAKAALEALHTNITVLRHRSRFSKNVYWSHHEKTVICDQRVAFVGGIDLALMRYDDWRHRLDDDAAHLWRTNDYQNIRVVDFHDVDRIQEDVIDRSHVPRQPWRDIACQVWGAAATDVGRHFVERWDHARRLTGLNYYDLYPGLELQAPDRPAQKKTVGDARGSSSSSAAAAVLHALDTDMGKPSAAYRNLPAPQQVTARDSQNLTSVQVLRSVGRWSCGARHESSIHAAYCSLIENSEKMLYIENQFFASGASAGDQELGNRVAHALASRLVRAARAGETFRCMFILPLLPGFANEVDKTTGKAGPLLTVMYYQYRTICKGPTSILGQLQAAIDKAVRDGVLPAGACVEDYVRFFGLRNWGRLGSRCVTEDVYVHSKAMIVDDETVVIGSANLNDRSMLGNRDSEMCLCCTDESRKFGASMRRATMCEFFGKAAGAAGALDNWTDDAVWRKIGKISRDNTEAFRAALFPVPDDTVTSWSQLKAKQGARQFDLAAYPPDQLLDGRAEGCEEVLNRVQGVVVDFPLKFLEEEDLTPTSLSAEGLAPAIFN